MDFRCSLARKRNTWLVSVLLFMSLLSFTGISMNGASIFNGGNILVPGGNDISWPGIANDDFTGSDAVAYAGNIRSSAIMAEFHVSPSGDDGNNGTLQNPFKTIAHARDAVRPLLANMTGDIVVYIHDGVYFLDDTLSFGPADGGNGNYSVIYRAYPGDTPVLSGGRVVGNWTEWQDGIWKASCTVQDFRQVYVNGRRATRARGMPFEITRTTGDGHETRDPAITTWKNLQDVEFVYQDIWTLPRVRPFMVKEKDGKYIIYMQQPAYSYTRYKPDSQNKAPVWIENALELLDEPGEWYLDKSTDTLYYKPLSGEKMSQAEVIVPFLEKIVDVKGTVGNKVSNLKFEGLSFQHGTWLKPNEMFTNFVDGQANVYRVQGTTQWTWVQSPGNVNCEYATNVHFTNCTFLHLGTAGLDLQAGVNCSSVTGSLFNDISGCAIQVGEIDNPYISPDDPEAVRDIDIMNNYIVNCSQEYMSGPGIFATYVRNVRIEHNTISNLPYTGISLGWGWSARETVCGNNSVKFNDIHGVMNFLKDGGGIYTLSTQPGTNVSYNVIHDSGYNGLYPDERTNGTTWSYNVVYDTWNDFLDHSMYEESKWNDVHHNYLEDYPKFLWVWYPDRDPDQIWGLRPGDQGFPDWIVEMAGVEDAYKHLVPEDEQYFRFVEETGATGYKASLEIYWALTVAFAIATVIGAISLARRPSRGKFGQKEVTRTAGLR